MKAVLGYIPWLAFFAGYYAFFHHHLYYEAFPEAGTVVEKYKYPAHMVCRLFQVEPTGGLVAEDPSPHVYQVYCDEAMQADQWIVKLSVTNLQGAPQWLFLNVPFETWIKNRVGDKFKGLYYEIPVRWM